MREPDRGTPGSSFGAAAQQYDRLRPTYPASALRWALGPRPARVVDLGAGTGVLTRALAGLGHEVLPVEPDPTMRTQLAASNPGQPPLAGAAEAIPIPDASVDAVLVGQAYHWFDRAAAHTEIARVLRPTGLLVALWNHPDDSLPWVADFLTITDEDRSGLGIDEPELDSYGPGFGAVTRKLFPHQATHTVASLLGLLTTRSRYLTADARERRELEDRLRRLCATHPDLVGRASFPLPYVCDVYRARKRTGEAPGPTPEPPEPQEPPD